MNTEIRSYLEHPKIFPLDRPGIIGAILFAQFLVVLPLFQQVSVWITITSLAAMGWRLGNQLRQWSLPGRWSRLLLGMLAAAAVIIDHHALFTKQAGLSLFVVMSSLRMLELNRQRDGMNSIFLAFFLLSINFLYSQTILMAGYAVLTSFWLVFCLNGLQSLDGIEGYKQTASVTFRIFLVTLPLSVVLFLFFPRLSHPLWQMPGSSSAGTGVSDSMTPGDISSLSLTDEIAFRVKFKKAVPLPGQLYWRGLVLSQFDGLTWHRGEAQGGAALSITGSAIDYTIYLEPHKHNWLFFLDMPVKTKATRFIKALPNEQFINTLNDKVEQRLQYQGSSYLRYIAVPQLSKSIAQYYLQLPATGNQRIKAWARSLRAQVTTDEAFINRVLQYIYQQPFRYTLQPDILAKEGIDDFWFNTQNGFCEHYASSLAFIARAAGIPARIVIGYQGGEKNPFSENWIVRQKNAHAWTELWLQGRGWQRVDPTAAINPSRVERGASSSYRQRDPLFDASEFRHWVDDDGVFHKLQQMWDAVNSNWQKWIIDFNQDAQGELMQWAGLGDYSWSKMFRIILMATGLALFLWFLSTFGGREKVDPAVELYLRLCKRLEKLGFARKLSEGPKDYLQRIQARHPEWVTKAAPIISNYINFRYRDIAVSEKQMQQMSRQIVSIKAAK